MELQKQKQRLLYSKRVSEKARQAVWPFFCPGKSGILKERQKEGSKKNAKKQQLQTTKANPKGALKK